MPTDLASLAALGVEDDASASRFWTPEYQPDSIMPPDALAKDANVISMRSTSSPPP